MSSPYFITACPSLLGEWSEGQFSHVEASLITHYTGKDITTSTGNGPTVSRVSTFDQLSNLLGLAYASGSSCAGLWVCNVELPIGDGFNIQGFVLDAAGAVWAFAQDADETERYYLVSGLLGEFRPLALSAWRWSSFDPERRGRQFIAEYERVLSEDLAGIPADQHERYISNFKKYVGVWLAAISRCASGMVTGRANFPVARQEKAHRSEENKYRQFNEWRKRALAAIARSQRAEIDPLADAMARLDERKKRQEAMKAVNALVKRLLGGKIDHAAYLAGCAAAGVDEAEAESLLCPPSGFSKGFGRFSLSNNLAEIKRLEERVKTLQAKAAAKSTPSEDFTVGGVRVLENKEIDRLQLFFPGKPSAEIVALLKRHAFKWSPSQGCWQRQDTPNARFSLRSYVLPVLQSAVNA